MDWIKRMWQKIKPHILPLLEWFEAAVDFIDLLT